MTREEIIAFLEKHSGRNMFLAKMRGKIKRKGFDKLTKNEMNAILKRMKDKDGALPFDYEQFHKGGFLE